MKVILVLLNMDESVCDFFFFNVGVFCERVKMSGMLEGNKLFREIVLKKIM